MAQPTSSKQSTQELFQVETDEKKSDKKQKQLQKSVDTYEKFVALGLNFDTVTFQNVLNSLEDQMVNYLKEDNMEKIVLPEGYQIIIVEKETQVKRAIKELRQKSKDNMISIDFEWRSDQQYPSTKPNKVALVSVATEKLCVLFRVCKWGFKISHALRDFLCLQHKTMLVQNPFLSDNKKTKKTLRINTYVYHDFIDYTWLLLSMGYHETGVAKSCENIWGVKQNKDVALSDWEAINLSEEQIHYAAMDVFITSTTVRYLKQQYINKKYCQKCYLKYGDFNPYCNMTIGYCENCHRGRPGRKEKLVVEK